MSLINQMLQDLEKRQAAAAPGELPSGVRSSPAAPAAARRSPLPLAALVALAVLGAGVYFWRQPASPPPVTVSAAALPAADSPPPAPPEPEPKPEPLAAPAPEAPPAAEIPAKEAKPKAARPATSSPAPKRAVVAERSPQKPAAVAKSSPVDEAKERAEQSFRSALNAYALGRTTESLEQSRLALAVDPAHLGARQLLVRQLVEQRASEQARAALREGLQLHPEQVAWAMLLTRLELERGDLPAARQVVDQAVPHAAANADFQSLAGAVAYRQGRQGEAADFYRSALRLKPAEGRAWVGLALALEAEGHAPEAREAFRRALATEGLGPELQALAERKLR